MNCQICHERMTDWLGENPQTISVEFLSHLQECRTCSAEWEALQGLVSEIKLSDPIQKPDDLFWQKQRITIQKKIRKSSSFLWLPRWAMVFSLGMLLFFVGYQTFSKYKNAQTEDWISWAMEEEEEHDLDETIDQMNPEQVQQAIQNMENDTRGRLL